MPLSDDIVFQALDFVDWIALPRVSSATDLGRLAVAIVPQLDPANGATLGTHAMHNWPADLCALIAAGNALEVEWARTASDPPALLRTHWEAVADARVWNALLPPTTPITRAAFETDGAGAQTFSYPRHDLERHIEELYDAMATALAPSSVRLGDAMLEALDVSGWLSAFIAADREIGRAWNARRAPQRNDRELNTAIVQSLAYFDAMRPPAQLRREIPTEKDFHERVVLAGQHRRLQRLLGLAVDGSFSVPPAWVTGFSGVLRTRVTGQGYRTPWLRFTYATENGLRVFRADSRGEYAKGLLKCGASQRVPNAYSVTQVDVEGALFQMHGFIKGVVEGSFADDPSPPPHLRGSGLTLNRRHRGRWMLEDAAALPPDPVIHLEDVVRGWRVDVHDSTTDRWQSLCATVSRYHEGLGMSNEDVNEEGIVADSSVLALTPPVDPKKIGANEGLFHWDGWSLVAMRPGRGATQDESDDRPRLRAAPGTLPRLRLGRSYQFRARAVDVAGNSLELAQADSLVDAGTRTAPKTVTRVEPIEPPVVISAADGNPANELVLRSVVESEGAIQSGDTVVAFIVPPRVGAAFAEFYGKFDDFQSASDIYAFLAEREAATDSEAGIPPTALQLLRSGRMPYVPDPEAAQAIVRGLDSIDPWHASSVIVDFSEGGRLPWRSWRPIRLELHSRPGRSRTGPGVLAVSVPAGQTVSIGVQSVRATSQKALSWLHGATHGSLADHHPMLSPLRTLTLVHAVTRPTEVPVIQAWDNAGHELARAANATHVVLPAAPVAELASTGLVAVYARWQTPTDDPTRAEPSTERRSMVAFTAPVPATAVRPPAMQEVPVTGELRHELGDTRHHRVTYTPVGTTRHVERFGGHEAEEDHLRSGTPLELHVHSSRAPDAPLVNRILPVYGWGAIRSGIQRRSRKRAASRLAVYLQRPWYSSGVDEFLAVALLRPVSAVGDGPSGELMHLVSQVGLDPLGGHSLGDLQPWLLKEHIGGPIVANVPLAELPGLGVDIVPFKPTFDSAYGAWRVVIPLKLSRVFKPMVRLALARYQPYAAAELQLSRITPAYFAPIAPDRVATIAAGGLSSNVRVTVSGSGPGPGTTLPGTILTAALEIDEAGHEAGCWMPRELERVTLNRTTAQFESAWTGTLSLRHARSGARARIVIREFEAFPGPEEEASRLVYAEAFDL